MYVVYCQRMKPRLLRAIYSVDIKAQQTILKTAPQWAVFISFQYFSASAS